MCEQCSAEVDEYGSPLPGWSLVQATKDGNSMKKGQWGLVLHDDPSYIWTPRPIADELDKFTDADVDNLESGLFWKWWKEFSEPAEAFETALVGSAREGYLLYAAALASGYEPEKFGRFAYWLFNLLALWLKDHPEPTVKNRFTPISKERGEEIMNELAEKRGITRAQLDGELTQAANKSDEES